jgi:acylphosphatase
VGFRLATAHEARRRNLHGWVRNLDSGGVEAVFEGPRPSVERMVQWCEQGPPGAYVRKLQVTWDEPVEHLAGFSVRPTSVT